MGALDMFSGVGGSVGGIVVPILIIAGFLAAGIYGLFAFGLLDGVLKRYQTVALCYEKRRNNLVFTGMDQLQAQSSNGKLTYLFKKRKEIIINVPSLNFIDIVKGKNVVHMYVSGRMEAHPIDIRIYTTKDFKKDAWEAYEKIHKREPKTVEEAEKAFSLIDVEGEMFKNIFDGKAPTTLEEFEGGVLTKDADNHIQFLPTVNEGQVNLLAEQIAADKATYATSWEKLKELLPIIGPVIFVFALGIGLFLTFGKIDEIVVHLGQIIAQQGANAASGANIVKDVIPVEMP